VLRSASRSILCAHHAVYNACVYVYAVYYVCVNVRVLYERDAGARVLCITCETDCYTFFIFNTFFRFEGIYKRPNLCYNEPPTHSVEP